MKNSSSAVVFHILHKMFRRLSFSRPLGMKKGLCRLCVPLVLIALVPAGQAVGADTETSKKTQIEGKEPAKPDKPYGEYGGFWAQPSFKPDQPKDWWERSSFEYSPEYPYFLKHITAQLSYVRLSGSSDGTLANGSLAFYLRKGRLSNSLSYSIDQKYVKHESGYISLDRDMQTFEETLKYELNRHLFMEAGMFWRRISTVNILDRYLPFIGIGTYNILESIGLKTKKNILGVEIGVAKVFDTYYPWVSAMTGKKSDSYTAVYLKADYTLAITPALTYRQNFLMKNATDKTPVYKESPYWSSATIQHYNLRYDWRWSNSLEYNFNRFIGGYISFDLIYDSNQWPTKTGQDTLLAAGFRLTL